MAPPNNKATKIMEVINAHPRFDNRRIAKKVGCTTSYISMIRAKMAHVDEVSGQSEAEPYYVTLRRKEMACLEASRPEVKGRIEANRHEVPEHQQHLITEHEWDGRGDRSWCRHGIDDLGERCAVCAEEDRKALLAQEEPMLPLDLNDAPTQEELDEVLEAASILNPDTLDEVLNERGSRYGSFLKHAIITQRFKAVMTDTPNWIKLDDDMVEALEMIAHKIGRILNGDPSYADSWVDIAGYSKLVADRLQGKER